MISPLLIRCADLMQRRDITVNRRTQDSGGRVPFDGAGCARVYQRLALPQDAAEGVPAVRFYDGVTVLTRRKSVSAITSGASVECVPVFFFAMMASTTTSGFSACSRSRLAAPPVRG